MRYEFNNWRALFDMAEFIITRHPSNYPSFRIEVPFCHYASTWSEWDRTLERLKSIAPDNLEEMSVYGNVSFRVTKDENLNNKGYF